MKSLRATLALALAMTLAACAVGESEAPPAPKLVTPSKVMPERLPAPTARALSAEVTALPDPADLPYLPSRLTYEAAPVVVLAGSLDDPALAELPDGLPVFELPEDVATLRAELDRLGTTHLLAVGCEVPEELSHLPVTDPRMVEGAPIEPAPWIALAPDDTLAGDVTAAGGELVVASDPRASSAAIDALSARPDVPVVALGEADLDRLEWQVAAARTGVRLPGDGTQLVAEGKMYVALYGHPGSEALGMLGEQGAGETVARAAEYAGMYTGLTDVPVVPTLEIIATVASASEGDDGNYSAESAPDHLRPMIDAATAAGQYVILDLQPGRTDFLTQAQRYEEFLLQPNVGLALDPEWRLEPDQVHLRQIGGVETAEVNEVITWLADLTRANALPQKMLVLHSFTTSMVRNISALDTTREELALVMHVDGQGSHGAKLGTWRSLRDYAAVVPYWGWKNFVDEDTPAMMTPEQTMDRVDPEPLLITYQ